MGGKQLSAQTKTVLQAGHLTKDSRLVIFDMDETLAVTERVHTAAWREVLARIGVEFDRNTWYSMSGDQTSTQLNSLFHKRHIKADPSRVLDAIEEEFKHQLFKLGIERSDNVARLISLIQCEKRLVSLSGPKTINTVISYLNYSDRFDKIHSGWFHGKDKLSILKDLISEFGGKNITLVDDNEKYINFVNIAGGKTIGVVGPNSNVTSANILIEI